MYKNPAQANILRHPVFVEKATHVECSFDFDLFGNKIEKPAKDSFALIFVAAGKPAFQCFDYL